MKKALANANRQKKEAKAAKRKAAKRSGAAPTPDSASGATATPPAAGKGGGKGTKKERTKKESKGEAKGVKFTPPPPKTSGTASTPAEAELSEDGDLYLEETDESTDSDGNGTTSGELMAKSPTTLRPCEPKARSLCASQSGFSQVSGHFQHLKNCYTRHRSVSRASVCAPVQAQH